MALVVALVGLLSSSVLGSGPIATVSKDGFHFSNDVKHDFNWEIRKVRLSDELLLDVEIINGTKSQSTESITSNDKMVPLLFIHGWLDSRLDWMTIMPYLLESGVLPNNQLIILPSLRGHGDSNTYPFEESTFSMAEFASDLTLLLNKLGVEKAVWIGHSMGGWVTLTAAMHKQQFVHSMVLMDSLPYWPKYLRGLYNFDNTQILTQREKYDLFHPFQSEQMKAGILSTELGDLLTSENLKVSTDAIVKSYVALESADLREAAHISHVLDMPSIVMFGENDFFSASDQRQYASMIDANKVIEYKGVGHDPHYRYPEQVSAEILHFIYPHYSSAHLKPEL